MLQTDMKKKTLCTSLFDFAVYGIASCLSTFPLILLASLAIGTNGLGHCVAVFLFVLVPCAPPHLLKTLISKGKKQLRMHPKEPQRPPALSIP